MTEYAGREQEIEAREKAASKSLRNEPLLADATRVLNLLELADKMPLTGPEDKLVRALKETLCALKEARKKLAAVENYSGDLRANRDVLDTVVVARELARILKGGVV